MAYHGYKPAEQAVSIGEGAVISSDILDGTIVNTDINSNASIATSKVSGALTSVGSHGLATSATTDTTSASNISSGTLAAARVATLNQNTTGTAATVTTAAQPNITSVGTLSSLTVTGNVTLNTGDSETALTFTDAGTNAMHIKVGDGDEIYFGSDDSWQTRYKTDGNVQTQGNWDFLSDTVQIRSSQVLVSESGGSQSYLYSGGSFTALRTTSSHPLHLSANYSSGDDALVIGTDKTATFSGGVDIIKNSGGGHPIIKFVNHVNDGEATTVQFRKSRNTTIGSHTVVQDNDELGNLTWYASDGNSWERSAAIKCFVDGAPGDGDVPGRLEFQTTADGASAPATKMTIAQDGGVGIGTTEPLGGRFHVQGKELLMRSPGGTNQFYVWGVDANENNCGVSIYQDDGTQTIQLHTDGASYFTGGGIGIGLTSPQTHGATAGIHLANSTELGFGDGANNRPDFGITGDSDHLNIFCGEGSDDVDTKWDTNGNMFIQNGSLWVSNGIKTSVSSASKATGNYFDVFTVPNDPLKMILAHSTITGSDGPGNYNRVDLVFGAGGSYKIVNLDDTSYMNAQMSGATYQVQQTSGGTQTISTRWLIIA